MKTAAWGLVLLLVIGGAVAGCTSGGDDGGRFGQGDDDRGDDDGGDDDAGGPPDAPLIDPVPNPYPLDVIALTGTAEPRTTLAVAGGPEPVQTLVDAAGAFCILVKLTMVDFQTTHNVLFVTVTDDEGLASPTVQLDIWTDPTGTPTWRNVAGDGTAMASSTNGTCDCAPVNATDADRETTWGSATSAAEGAGWNVSPQWLWVDLGTNHYLRAIQVTWGPDYPEVHAVYLSAEIDPTAPDVNLDEWTQVGYSDYTGGEQRTYDVSYTLARHVALTMTGGNHRNPDTDAYYYRVKELTINGVPWDEYVPEPSCPSPE